MFFSSTGIIHCCQNCWGAWDTTCLLLCHCLHVLLLSGPIIIQIALKGCYRVSQQPPSSWVYRHLYLEITWRQKKLTKKEDKYSPTFCSQTNDIAFLLRLYFRWKPWGRFSNRLWWMAILFHLRLTVVSPCCWLVVAQSCDVQWWPCAALLWMLFGPSCWRVLSSFPSHYWSDSGCSRSPAISFCTSFSFVFSSPKYFNSVCFNVVF